MGSKRARQSLFLNKMFYFSFEHCSQNRVIPRTTISNSVAAGHASHENPTTLNMVANMSPRIAGGDKFAGKYPKNLDGARRDRHRDALAVSTFELCERVGFSPAGSFYWETIGRRRYLTPNCCVHASTHSL